MPIIADEINIHDFILITAIQLFEYEIYTHIKNNKNLFIETAETTTLQHKEDMEKNIKEDIEESYKKLSKISKEEYIELLQNLFPNIALKNKILLPTGYSLEKEKKLCHHSHFDKYFTLSLEETEVNEKMISEIIQSNNKEFITNKILELTKENKGYNLMHKIYLNRDKIPEENINLFIESITKYGDTLNHLNLENLILLLLNQKPSNEICYILKNAINNSNNGIYVLSEIISTFNYDYGMYTFKNENPKSEEEMIINKNHLKELEECIALKIREKAKNGELNKHPKLNGILYYWANWEDETILNKFFKKNIQTDNEFLKFIKNFVLISHNNIQIDIEQIKKYVPDYELNKKIESAKKNLELNKLETEVLKKISDELLQETKDNY